MARAAGIGTRPLERDGELSRIRRAIGAGAEGSGQLLVIEGPSGIGKSRLLDEARALAVDAGMEALRGRGGELERDYSFGVVLRLLEGRFARATDEERQALLRGRAALAAPLLSHLEDHLGGAATTDEFALVHGLYWCVVNITEERPAALLVDDVQWADDLSLRFLIYLAERLEDLPVVLIVAIRTGDPSAESDLVTRLSDAAAGASLRPAELSPEAVGEVLAGAGIETAAKDDFVRASWKVTGGNPFLVQELVATLRAEGGAEITGDPRRLAAFAPESVRRRVVLRLKSLGTEAHALARACAVMGDETPLATVAQVAGLELGVATAAAQRLVSAHILAGSEPASFAHPMQRSAVYGEIPLDAAPVAHATAARLLHRQGKPAELVAHHLVAATPIAEDWARAALHQGAREAARKGAPATAVRFLRRALELSEAGQRRAAMLVDLGLVEAASGETTSLARFEEALATIEEPAEQARALYALGQTLYRYGRHAEAATTFRRGAQLFEDEDRELALSFEGAYMCAAYFDSSTHPVAIPRLESMAAAIRRDQPMSAAERVLVAVLALHRLMTAPPAAPAAALALDALGGGTLLREQTADSLAVNIATFALWLGGRTEQAQGVADAVLADARDRGLALAFAEASMVRAVVMYARGRITEATADAQAAIEGMDRGWHSTGSMPQAILAQCLIERGELDAAQTALSAGELTPSGLVNVSLYWARGRLRLLQGDAAGALEDFLAAGAALEPFGVINPALMPWRSLAGTAAHGIGDDERAAALIDEELALARAFLLPAQIGGALRARAMLAGDEDRVAMLEEAVAILEDSDAALELARALLDLGMVLRRAGRRVDSREPLRRALDIAHRCGATALERQAHEELLASGARPRSAAISGAEALTPSERRVAELAAQGRTNREIAETLFLTKNTVAWHLRHIYRKLDVDSRDAIVSCLQEKDNV